MSSSDDARDRADNAGEAEAALPLDAPGDHAARDDAADEVAADGAEVPSSFEEALAELEAIVEAVSEDRVPIDELGSKVARGAALVAACRRQLDATEVEVTRVADELARLAESGATTIDAETAPGERRETDNRYGGALHSETLSATDDAPHAEGER